MRADRLPALALASMMVLALALALFQAPTAEAIPVFARKRPAFVTGHGRCGSISNATPRHRTGRKSDA